MMYVFLLILFYCEAGVIPEVEPENRIFSGKQVQQGEWPFMVAIGYNIRRENRVLPLCGGAIIDERHVVTAAHCGVLTDSLNIPKGNFVIMVGSTKVTADYGTWYSVQKIFLTNDKKDIDGLPLDDIILMRIWGKFEFNDEVQPINITTKQITQGSRVYIAGWGLIDNFQTNSMDLLRTSLTTLNQKDCKTAWTRAKGMNTKFCAVSPINTGTCKGDSGGPLVADGQLVGLLSFGDEICANGVPEVYVNVAAFTGWINAVLQHNPDS